MNQSQTGAEQMQNYFAALSNQLQRMAVRYDLDIAEMEALTQLASTAMESPSQNFSQALRTLMSGLKDLDLITNNPDMLDVVIATLLQTVKGVRYATIVRRPGHAGKVVAYVGR